MIDIQQKEKNIYFRKIIEWLIDFKSKISKNEYGRVVQMKTEIKIIW